MKEYYKSLSDFFKSLMLFCATISTGLIAYIYTGNDYNMLPIFATFIFLFLVVIFAFIALDYANKLE
ncbi:hypothetical protein [Helicobacter bilis]|uniref:Uncharacterized protein n=1 Tax=Helicobacter bilis TaxID=37372 RepID=A0A4U8U6W0_9HELI|nr:hypothetical protein [Helicobacter bilis]TLE09101.1 hypothetical protein LS79_008540 [Helicobacter bilis]